MYGNQYGPFMMPGNMPYAPYGQMMGTSRSIFNPGGIRSLFRGINSASWQGMLNNVSRTLGVVREAIPVVKEIGPMINNMRSMIKIASVFKDETDTKKQTTSKVNESQKESSTNESTTINQNNYNEPNFFL